MARLSEDELTTALGGLPGWESGAGEIVRGYEFADFVAAMAFVNRVADLAEAAGHHPDIDIRYNRVRIALTTHDEGGVSERDIQLASQIDGAA